VICVSGRKFNDSVTHIRQQHAGRPALQNTQAHALDDTNWLCFVFVGEGFQLIKMSRINWLVFRHLLFISRNCASFLILFSPSADVQGKMLVTRGGKIDIKIGIDLSKEIYSSSSFRSHDNMIFK
jgi:hypothetical protein